MSVNLQLTTINNLSTGWMLMDTKKVLNYKCVFVKWKKKSFGLISESRPWWCQQSEKSQAWWEKSEKNVMEKSFEVLRVSRCRSGLLDIARRWKKCILLFAKAAHTPFTTVYLDVFAFCLDIHCFVSLPFLGLHQSSIIPDSGEEWQERTVFVILFQWISKNWFISIDIDLQ